MIKISFKHDPDIKQPHAEIPHNRHSEAIRSDLRKGNNQNCNHSIQDYIPSICPQGRASGPFTMIHEIIISRYHSKHSKSPLKRRERSDRVNIFYWGGDKLNSVSGLIESVSQNPMIDHEYEYR